MVTLFELAVEPKLPMVDRVIFCEKAEIDRKVIAKAVKTDLFFMNLGYFGCKDSIIDFF
jgi:hypothetical protein